jgi:hypothetical protein
MREVAHAPKDVRAQLVITTSCRKVQRAVEVTLGSIVQARVVRHPPRHLSERRRRAEDQWPILMGTVPEEPRSHPLMEIGDDGRVQVTASDLAVCRPEGLHGRQICFQAGRHCVS